MMIKAVALLLLLITVHLAYGQEKTELSKTEKKEIWQAHTGKYALYMGRQEREFIKLMNLCRTNGPLFVKYVKHKYGEELAKEEAISVFDSKTNIHTRPYLRPSLGLHLSAASHAILSGITAYEGHRLFGFRNFLFLNLNCIYTASGENCEYGSRKAIDILVNLLNSPPHRSNILSRDFMRAGVSRKLHFQYTFNTVTVFSGPKLMDEFFYRKTIKKHLR